MDEIASTRTPTAPQGTGAVYVKVYGVTDDGIKYDLPAHFEVKPGDCADINCVCLAGATR
ncbi:hypothetical protein KDL01_29080 [Actinospica durhamensis]|uniref:Uncharacterized protein n=1 Tax=Actinospica durhamensis TaxID=1508375 RepID=A0A941EUA7_9ACTN|nr:hypothetical protein [Actinospica durhamensis]MBR7837368.1 hypothetical protein [Actinospica durhamensis]